VPSRPLGGKRDCMVGGDVSQASLAIETNTRPIVVYGERFSGEVDATLLNMPNIAIQHTDAVGIKAQ
jgi:hypothetical protein